MAQLLSLVWFLSLSSASTVPTSIITIDQCWRHGPITNPGATMTRIQYDYDLMGNRIESVRTTRPTPGPSNEHQRQISSYDLLNRLKTWKAEDIDASQQPTFLLRDDTWVLDLLGNWNERQTHFGGGNDLKIEHATDGRNRIDGIDTIVNQGSPESTTLIYDDAGNLIFDGQHYYQYDAWNRLVQINLAELDDEVIVARSIVKHYTYDAAGRLVRTQSPYPEPEDEDGVVRSERFYYDGIRRIVEVVIDPVESLMSAESSPEMSLLASQTVGMQQFTLDGESTPSTFEAAQMGDDDPAQPPLPSSRIDREYVWGPGDRGVDELIAQFDPWGELMPVLQDQGGDAIALCDLQGSGGLARIVAQYTYDPYGQVITHEHLVPGHAYLRAGHKGLFVDRLDAGVANWMGEDLPRLVAGADLVVQNRNRVLKPDLGRFLQKDPNASGLVLMQNQAHAGGAIRAAKDAFDLHARYADSSNLFEYARSNTSRYSDPLGLMVGYAVRGGMNVGLLAYELGSQYSMNLMFDSEWALDWSQDDRGYSRLQNDWITEIQVDTFNRMSRQMIMGVLADVIDLVEAAPDLFEYVYDYLAAESDDGPAMAFRAPGRLPLRRTIKHGEAAHRGLMMRGLFWIRGMGVSRQNLRMNQALVDPVKNVRLSRMRPDVQGFRPPNTIYIFEAVVSGKRGSGVSKWSNEAINLRAQGYTVIIREMRP